MARSARRREELRRDPRVPYIHGPREDANPIIDYVIKSHKYRDDGRGRAAEAAAAAAAAGGARPGGDVLMQLLQETKTYNRVEDERQLAGAADQLSRRGHLTAPVLLSEKLSRDVAIERRAEAEAEATAAGEHPELYRPVQYAEIPHDPGRVVRGGGGRRYEGPADRAAQWSHDKFGRGRSGSRSLSRSRSFSRSRSRSPSRSRRPPAPPPPAAPAVRERPSPTYEDYD